MKVIIDPEFATLIPPLNDAATYAAQLRVNGKRRRWIAVADKTAKALEITGGEARR